MNDTLRPNSSDGSASSSYDEPMETGNSGIIQSLHQDSEFLTPSFFFLIGFVSILLPPDICIFLVSVIHVLLILAFHPFTAFMFVPFTRMVILAPNSFLRLLFRAHFWITLRLLWLPVTIIMEQELDAIITNEQFLAVEHVLRGIAYLSGTVSYEAMKASETDLIKFVEQLRDTERKERKVVQEQKLHQGRNLGNPGIAPLQKSLEDRRVFESAVLGCIEALEKFRKQERTGITASSPAEDLEAKAETRAIQIEAYKVREADLEGKIKGILDLIKASKTLESEKLREFIGE